MTREQHDQLLRLVEARAELEADLKSVRATIRELCDHALPDGGTAMAPFDDVAMKMLLGSYCSVCRATEESL